MPECLAILLQKGHGLRAGAFRFFYTVSDVYGQLLLLGKQVQQLTAGYILAGIFQYGVCLLQQTNFFMKLLFDQFSYIFESLSYVS